MAIGHKILVNFQKFQPLFKQCIRCAANKSAEVEHAGKGGLWRNISFGCLASLLGLSALIMKLHSDSHTCREPFVDYEHMRIRRKRFPWGEDGQKSLFHNPETDALKEGYEAEDTHCEQEEKEPEPEPEPEPSTSKSKK